MAGTEFKVDTSELQQVAKLFKYFFKKYIAPAIMALFEKR